MKILNKFVSMKVGKIVLASSLFLIATSAHLNAHSCDNEIETIKQNFRDIYIDADTDSPLMQELSLHQPRDLLSPTVWSWSYSSAFHSTRSV